MLLPLPASRIPDALARCLRRRGLPGLLLSFVGGLCWGATPSVGVDVTIDGSTRVSGGPRSGTALHGLALVRSEWSDTNAAADRPVWAAKLSLLGIAGQGPSGKFLGDVLTISNAEGHESFRLYTTWAEVRAQRLACRVGLLLADEEFASSDAGSHLINASFGWPIFISANTVNTGPAFYAAGAGARLRLTLSDRTSLQWGIYDGDTFDSETGDPAVNRDGLHYRLGGEQGWFSMLELSSRINDRLRAKLGAWVHTARFADLYFDEAGQSHATTGANPRRHRGNGGAYAVLQQRLRGAAAAPGAIDSYVRVGAAPSDRNTFHWAFDCGVSWHGPFAARPDDVLAVGFTHAHHSDRFVKNARDLDPSAIALDFEEVWELSYRMKISDRFALQPDLQHVRHPGGSALVADATVFQLRLTAAY